MPNIDIRKACTLTDLIRYKHNIDRLKLGVKHDEPYDEQFTALGVKLSDKPSQSTILARLDQIAQDKQVGPYRTKVEVALDPEPPTPSLRRRRRRRRRRVT